MLFLSRPRPQETQFLSLFFQVFFKMYQATHFQFSSRPLRTSRLSRLLRPQEHVLCLPSHSGHGRCEIVKET